MLPRSQKVKNLRRKNKSVHRDQKAPSKSSKNHPKNKKYPLILKKLASGKYPVINKSYDREQKESPD